MSEIQPPVTPRRDNPAEGYLIVQQNLEYFMGLFEKGAADGDVPTWDAALSKYVATALPSPVVATTVAGLGTPSDGQSGLLRVGSTPYDFLGLTYDATYGKWVSAEQSDYLWPTTNASVSQTDVIAVAELAPTNQPPYGPLLYKVFKDAGLTMQARLTIFAVADPSKSANFQIGHRTWNTGATGLGTTSFNSTVTTVAGGGGTQFKDSGWLDLSPTNNDFIGFTMGAFRASGGTGISISFSVPRIHWRWVG